MLGKKRLLAILTAISIGMCGLTAAIADTDNTSAPTNSDSSANNNASSAFSFPAGCDPSSAKVNDDQYVLTPTQDKSGGVFLFYNASANAFVIDHPVADPGASAGWATELKPGRWSALMLTEANFAITCSDEGPGYENQLTCADVMKVCEMKPSKNADLGINGSYWLTENKMLLDLFPAIESRGINLQATHTDAR